MGPLNNPFLRVRGRDAIELRPELLRLRTMLLMLQRCAGASSTRSAPRVRPTPPTG